VSIRIRRRDEIDSAEIASLERQLVEYYSKPPESYYQIADIGATEYSPDLHPFHSDLAGRVKSGMHVLELGCGSAHLCPPVESRGGIYTGTDHSAELMAQNRKRFPRARFLSLSEAPERQFDVVASLYTIEHVTDPKGYLKQMWNHCASGGLMGVICPDFVDGEGLAPSVFFGRTPRRLREKMATFSLADAALHLIDLYWKAPRWQSTARRSPPGAFWMNTKPSELHGKVHGIDTDALHLPRMADIEWWFRREGATILDTSHTLQGVTKEVLRHNCYVLARKP
jgi:2-polyprenyl-3-methyl-5-hydroxy-6-metoxy-1,4-benzoquinol methylase